MRICMEVPYLHTVTKRTFNQPWLEREDSMKRWDDRNKDETLRRGYSVPTLEIVWILHSPNTKTTTILDPIWQGRKCHRKSQYRYSKQAEWNYFSKHSHTSTSVFNNITDPTLQHQSSQASPYRIQKIIWKLHIRKRINKFSKIAIVEMNESSRTFKFR